MSDDDRLVTVCASCLQASCWLGEFYCDEYKTANIVEKTVAELRALNREHSDYWASGTESGMIHGPNQRRYRVLCEDLAGDLYAHDGSTMLSPPLQSGDGA